MSAKRVLLVRTFRDVGTGGPVPPLGLLYIASAIRRVSPDREIRLIDVGNEELTVDELRQEIADWKPAVLGLSVMTCEAELADEIAGAAKKIDPDMTVVVGGPHAMTAKEKILKNKHVDCVAVGEGEKTIVELLEAFAGEREISAVRGIAHRDAEGNPVLTESREPERDLDSMARPAWDLIDLPSYARHKNWNGTLKRKFYAPIVTSRGCPYSCTFCHNIFGKNVRFRSPEDIVDELRDLRERLGVEEFHVVDDIFNADVERAQKICTLIVDAGLDISLSFPNGLRADIMTDRLLGLLKEAGTYKINYGFETATPRLQKLLKKHVDIEKTAAVFDKTSDIGIITGAYFMLGIPTETKEEMLGTIRFAEHSKLDVAAFFKSTAYPGTELHKSLFGDEPSAGGDHSDELHFFSVGRSLAAVPPRELNSMILKAQRRFYMKPSRIFRGLRKAPRKGAYLVNLLHAVLLLMQGYLMQELSKGKNGRTPKPTAAD